MCMTDLFHFLESGSLLTSLTNSPLLQGSMELLLNWSSHPYLPLRVFKRLATFLRQVSLDNENVGSLWSEGLDSLVLGLCQSVNQENADFAAEMLGFHL